MHGARIPWLGTKPGYSRFVAVATFPKALSSFSFCHFSLGRKKKKDLWAPWSNGCFLGPVPGHSLLPSLSYNAGFVYRCIRPATGPTAPLQVRLGGGLFVAGWELNTTALH